MVTHDITEYSFTVDVTLWGWWCDVWWRGRKATAFTTAATCDSPRCTRDGVPSCKHHFQFLFTSKAIFLSYKRVVTWCKVWLIYKLNFCLIDSHCLLLVGLVIGWVYIHLNDTYNIVLYQSPCFRSILISYLRQPIFQADTNYYKYNLNSIKISNFVIIIWSNYKHKASK